MEVSREERNHIEWECQQLLNKVTTLTDRREWEALAQCYTEDALLYRPSDSSTAVKGREEILRSFTKRPPKETCHMLANTVFTVISKNEVKADSRVWLVSGEPNTELPIKSDSKLMIGSFCDELSFEKGSWYITERRGSIELKYDYSGA